MSFGKYYRRIDEIVSAMAEYLGVSEDDGYMFDDIYNEDDDLIDDTCCEYSDVQKCGSILESYVDELDGMFADATDEAILKSVEKTVKKLNKLNEKCDYELIDSTQAEEICQLIHEAALDAGFSGVTENVADEWRDF